MPLKKKRPTNLKMAREQKQLEEFAEASSFDGDEIILKEVLKRMVKGSESDEETSA